MTSLRNYIKPPAPLIILAGLDGSGKSTVLDHISKMDFPPPTKSAKLGYRRPGVVTPLPPRNEDGGEQEVTHYSKPNHSALKSAGKLFVMALDWFIGYWTKLAPDLANGHPVVFDRHYLIDLAIDPERYRYGGPLWLIYLAQRMIPQPRLVLFLDVSEEVSQARKQEPGAENFSEQRQAYLDIAKKSKNWRVIDASQTLPEVLAAVEKEIHTKLPQ